MNTRLSDLLQNRNDLSLEQLEDQDLEPTDMGDVQELTTNGNGSMTDDGHNYYVP